VEISRLRFERENAAIPVQEKEMKKRPAFLRNVRDLQPAEEYKSPTRGEAFGYPADFGRATGLTRLKLMHLNLPPGRRTNAPGAYRDEEEFFFVLEGAPDLWIDGHLYKLKEGDGVWFNDRTGISHTLINNTDSNVRIFAYGEATRLASQFAVTLERDAATANFLKNMGKLWTDPPKRKLGPNTAVPGDTSGRKKGQPPFVANWRDLLEPDGQSNYPGSKEQHGIHAPFNPRTRFSRVGIHAEILKPGRRTAWPHAEREEEEWVFVAKGKVDCWLDGYMHPMAEGDFVGWESRTGITHSILNNSDEYAILLVGGEASRMRNQFWYPFHPHQNKAIRNEYWADHPIPKLGPHDGLPNKLRASLPASARRSALAANTAAWKLGMRTKTP
jgi:uncharacterized cupin superfamily protein